MKDLGSAGAICFCLLSHIPPCVVCFAMLSFAGCRHLRRHPSVCPYLMLCDSFHFVSNHVPDSSPDPCVSVSERFAASHEATAMAAPLCAAATHVLSARAEASCGCEGALPHRHPHVRARKVSGGCTKRKEFIRCFIT